MKLITTLGTSRYSLSTYYLPESPDAVHSSRFAPVATAALHEGVDDVALLLTEEAIAAHADEVRGELTALGARVRIVDIQRGESENQLGELLEIVLGEVSGQEALALDISHALRHIPMVLFAAIGYASAVQGARLATVRYGAWEAGDGKRAPLLELAPMVDFYEAHHALRQLRDAGDPSALSKLLSAINTRMFRQREGVGAFGRLSHALWHLAPVMRTAMTLETGRAARSVLDKMQALEESGKMPPVVARSLVEELRKDLQPFALDAPPPDRKHELPLSRAELERQLRVASALRRFEAVDASLMVLREWCISRVLVAREETGAWLDYKGCRLKVEKALNRAAERRRRRSESEDADEDRASSIWQSISSRRNELAHAGMTDKWLAPSIEKVDELIEICGHELRQARDAAWRLERSGEIDELLVAPLGLSPGVLYTALVRVQPTHALVLTSRKAAESIDEICEKAGYDTQNLDKWIVDDPHRCFDASDLLASEPYARLVLSSKVIKVSVTGGTTALQFLAEKVARDAESVGAWVERVALIDDRPSDEQRRNPYVAGDVLTL